MNVQRACVCLTLLASLVACAYQSGGSSTADRDAELISSDEIRQAYTAATALDLVKRLRPEWLQTRGARSANRAAPIMVYVDRVQVGDAQSLAQIPANAVESLRFLNAMTATQQFGTDHASGAILVTSRGRSASRP